MRALDRKMLRDLWGVRGQCLAIILVQASGVAFFVMSMATMQSLEQTRATYYERHRFADAFAHVKRAPNTLADRLAEIPGVAAVQTRIARDVNLDVPGMAEPVIGRLLSLPLYGGPTLNEAYLRRGRLPELDKGDEVLVSESFANAHGLEPGHEVTAIINGRLQRLRIVGVALSPEFIFLVKPGGAFPDEKRYGVFWMNYRALAAAFNMEGAFNDLSLKLLPGADETEVLDRVDKLTAAFGGLGAYSREDQTSHRYVSDELKQLVSTGVIAPIIFLSVAAFLLNVVMTRLIATQREQIASLKAYGFTNLEIAWHYLKMVVLLVGLGVIFGTGLGIWFGQHLTQMYARFYKFPEFVFELEFRLVVLASFLSLLAGMVGTVRSVVKAVSLPPAEAMRPESPILFRASLVERLFLGHLMSMPTRMILRRLGQKPVQVSLSIFAIALSLGILIVSNFGVDAIDFMIDRQFLASQRYDAMISFVEPVNTSVSPSLLELPGVTYAELFRAVPARLRHGHRTYRQALLGLEADRILYRLFDTEQREIVLPEEGLVMSLKLAELLHLQVGDAVTVEVLEGRRQVLEVPVAAVVDDYAGLTVVLRRDLLHQLLGEAPCASGAHVLLDSKQLDELFAAVKRTPAIAGMAVKQATIRAFLDLVEENLLTMQFINAIFAGLIAFGVVYNLARIAQAERSRELATLRVIGFTRGEISFMLLGEIAFLTVVALPLGLMLGYGFAWLLAKAIESDLFRFPVVIVSSTYAKATLVILTATIVSSLLVVRNLDKLDLVAVLKAKD